jgi:hypothetical protein
MEGCQGDSGFAFRPKSTLQVELGQKAWIEQIAEFY